MNIRHFIATLIITPYLLLSNLSCSRGSPSSSDNTFALVKREMVLFSSNRTGNQNVFMMSPDGSDVRQLTHYSEGDFWPADVSPDGKLLLFYRFDEHTLIAGIFVMPIQGPEPTVPLDYGTYGGFFPDGKRFVYGSYVFNDSSSYDVIRICSLVNSSIKQISPDGVPCYEPSVSHDGTWISFISWRPVTSTHQQLFVMNSDGSNERALTPATAGRYARRGQFTSDDRKIIFTFNDGGASYDLYLVSPLGGALTPITRGESNENYYPCPDSSGNMVFYRSGHYNQSEIYSINLNGSNQRRLTQNQFLDDMPIVRVVEFLVVQ